MGKSRSNCRKLTNSCTTKLIIYSGLTQMFFCSADQFLPRHVLRLTREECSSVAGTEDVEWVHRFLLPSSLLELCCSGYPVVSLVIGGYIIIKSRKSGESSVWGFCSPAATVVQHLCFHFCPRERERPRDLALCRNVPTQIIPAIHQSLSLLPVVKILNEFT